MLPPLPSTFFATIPSGGRVALGYREAIGLAHLVEGAFEDAELRLVCGHVTAGAVIFDVGANIGYFTIPLAMAAGPSGRVFAFEPEPRNVSRLSDNVSLNLLPNVDIMPMAIGAYDGRVTLYLGDDSVYHTTAGAGERLPITLAHEMQQEISVEIARLDTVWRKLDSPHVALVKIDVEGTEMHVLEGSKAMIESCRPLVLVEADAGRFDQIHGALTALGYLHRRPKGFSISNHLFIPR